MNRLRRPCGAPRRSQMGLALLSTICSIAFAQAAPGEAPDNATATRYGSGWQCNRGFREVSGACIAVKVSDNGYATKSPYGRAW